MNHETTVPPVLSAVRWETLSERPPRLIVFLCHGIGSHGPQLVSVARAWGKVLPDAAFLAPDAPWPHRSHVWDIPWPRRRRRQWFSLLNQEPSALEAGVRRAAGALDGFIEQELARLSDPCAPFAMAGFSQGAMTVLFGGLRRSRPPAAIICMAGALMAPELLAGELRNRAPVLLLVGSDDHVVPPQASANAARVLAKQGVPVELRTLPGVGHSITEAGIADAADFLVRTCT